MTSNKKHLIVASICFIFILFSFTALRFYNSKSLKEIQKTDERELKVTMQAGYGNLYISRGKSSTILNAEMNSDSKIDLEDCIDYRVRDHIGYLNMLMDCKQNGESTRHRKSIHLDNLDSRNWYLQFADAIPISYDIELGLGRGDIDMTDLIVKDFNLSTGASSVKLTFNKPNKQPIEYLNLEAGVGKLIAEGLCNARFHHLKFEGGVGSYSLDFTGNLGRDAQADLEIGLGTLTIIIPDNIGAKIVYEKSWIAHLDLSGNFEESGNEENTYFSSNFNHVHDKITMRINAGMGSVKIRRASE